MVMDDQMEGQCGGVTRRGGLEGTPKSGNRSCPMIGQQEVDHDDDDFVFDDSRPESKISISKPLHSTLPSTLQPSTYPSSATRTAAFAPEVIKMVMDDQMER